MVFVNIRGLHKKWVTLTLVQKGVLYKKVDQGLHKIKTNASMSIIVTTLKKAVR